MRDQALIAGILARDRHALYHFYQAYSPKLIRFISLKINNTHDAEEVLQDTLYAFLEAVRDFQGNAKLETFLFSICRNKVVDYYRRKKLRHLVFSQVPQLEDLMSPILNPEEELDATLLKEKLRRTFRRLVPKYKIILQLKYLEEWSVSDIAGKFSWTLKSTESLLFRARKAFVKTFTAL